MSEVLIGIGGGGGTGSDELTADREKVLENYTAVTSDSDDEAVAGTMKHLTNRATITHASNNGTKVILGDAAFLSTNNDGVGRTEIRYNGSAGYVVANTLFAVANSVMAAAIGLTAGLLKTGTTILGITGTFTNDADAAAAHILSGKSAYVKGNKVSGSMANQGAKTAALNCGGSYTIPAGYHNGSGKVTANSLASQTSANAAAGHILSGKTAWVNGSKVTGTIGSRGAATITPGKSNQTIAAGVYLSGAQTIKGDANLVADNIVSGKTIFGVAGNAKKYAVYTATLTGSSSKAFFDGYGSDAGFNAYYVTIPALNFTPVYVSCSSYYSGGVSECANSSFWGLVYHTAPGGQGSARSHYTMDTSILSKAGFKLPVIASGVTAKVYVYGYY